MSTKVGADPPDQGPFSGAAVEYLLQSLEDRIDGDLPNVTMIFDERTRGKEVAMVCNVLTTCAHFVTDRVVRPVVKEVLWRTKELPRLRKRDPFLYK